MASWMAGLLLRSPSTKQTRAVAPSVAFRSTSESAEQRSMPSSCTTVARLPSLRFLHVIGVPLTDAGLEPLAEMAQLESFYIDDSRVTDDGIEQLLDGLKGALDVAIGLTGGVAAAGKNEENHKAKRRDEPHTIISKGVLKTLGVPILRLSNYR